MQNAYFIGIGASIRIGLEIRCLLYAGFLLYTSSASPSHVIKPTVLHFHKSVKILAIFYLKGLWKRWGIKKIQLRELSHNCFKLIKITLKYHAFMNCPWSVMASYFEVTVVQEGWLVLPTWSKIYIALSHYWKLNLYIWLF